MHPFVIVGGGLAGHTAALELARLGKHPVILLGEETHAPYDRPPLSKELLSAQIANASIPFLSKPNVYADAGITFRPRCKVTRILRDSRQIELWDGERIAYDRLLLAVGSSPVVLPCSPEVLKRIHKLRTYEDAQNLRNALLPERHLVVVGGGLIGLEVAAAARTRNMRVTILEAGDRIASRSVPIPISDWLMKLHTARGTTIALGERVTEISLVSDRLRVSSTTQQLDADEVLICVGIKPNTGVASNCGLLVADGIVVDEHCRTSDDSILAAGEVTNYPIAHWGFRRRLECWKVAATQPAIAARTMAGFEATYRDLPWFWSDQFNRNIQVVGLPDLAVETRIWDDINPDQNLGVTCIDANGFIVAAAGIDCGKRISTLRRAIEGQGRI